MRKTDRTMSMTKTLRGFESIPGTETVFVATEDEVICDRQKKRQKQNKTTTQFCLLLNPKEIPINN